MGLELHIYDFDGTLFRSPEKPEGWDNRWWISSESLNPPCVPLDPSGEWWISKTVSAARASIANPDTYAVMITGRPVRSGFRYRVPELLKSVGLKFDEVYLSDTNNTPAFKVKVIKNLLSRFPGVEKIVFWDDNAPYMARYVKLVEGYGYQAEANLVTVPAMECDEVPPMGEGPFRKEASEQVEVMKFLSAVARNAGIAEHVYVVGGAVRNFIIGQPIKDVDVVIDSVALRGRDSAWFARKIADSLPCESSLVTNNYGVTILTIKGPWILNGHDLSGEVIEIANARKESYGGEAGKGYKPNMVEPATIQEDVVRREFTFNCMAGDTLIPTERGILRIDEIASREDGVQQNINLKVAGQDGPATAVGWQYSGFAPTLRVTTEWGHSFACTHHHPVLVLRGCRHEWVQADQLGEGDLLCVPVRQVVRQTPLALELPDPVQPKRGALKEVIKPAVMTPELAFVIGCVVAEGSNTHKRVSFSNSDPALISRYVECFQAVFGFQPSRNKVVEKGSVRILRGVEFVANKDGYDIYADSKAVVGWLEDLGLYCGGSKNDRSASHYKVVPWSILQADEQSQSAFLAAYLEGDGSIRPDSGRMVFRSVSPHIRQQLQVLLGAHGVLGKVEGEFVYVNAVDAAVLWSKIHPWMVTKTFDYTSRKFKSRNRYGIPADYIKGFVAGRRQDANQSVYVTDGGASRTLFGVYEPVRKIQRLLHDAHARGDFDGFMASLKVISPDEHANLQRLFDLGYQYVGVTSVEDAGEQDVFDISMNEGVEPAFVANGVVVHNTLLWRLHDLADGPDKAEIIDLSGCGLRDLQSGTMRCPNDPDIVFSDDPSRMVRAIKFLLKYGFRIDPEVAASIKRNAGKLKKMPAAHLSTMLVETFFEPGVGKKALLEMDKLGLLDVVREIADEDKPFRAALDNWANKRSGLEFLFDLLDLQMPMGKRLSVVPQDLLPQFRAYSEAEPDKAVALLEVLEQPGRKFDMPRLIRELGISGAEIKNVANTIRRLLVLDPDLTEADLYRKLIQGRAIKTAATSDKNIYFNLARNGSGMNKVAQAIRVAARWALMKNAAPLKDVKHLRYQAVFLMGAAGSGKSYVGYRWMKYLPGPGGISTTTREQFEAPAHKRNVSFSEEERKLSKLDFNRVRDSLDKLGFDIEITTDAKAKIPFLIYSYDSNGKERLIPRDQWEIEIPSEIYNKIKDMEELEFAAAKNEFPSFWRTINPDVFKEEIPGYDTELPGYVHEMSSKMNNVYFEAAVETGDPIFVDSVGQNEKKMARWIETARKKGYRVQLVYVSVPLTVNLIRNLTRGREVNSMIIVDQWKVISRNFEVLKRLANKARKIDNRNNPRDFAIYKQNAERINDTILRHTNGEYPTLYDLIAKVAPQELNDYGDLLRQKF